MSEQNFTAERLRELLHYDPETGIFTWVKPQSRRVSTGDVLKNSSSAGLRAGIDGKRYLAHRLAWLYMTGSWPTLDIDHIDQNRTNNRWCNLRLATLTENNQNIRRPKKHNRSGFLGVVKSKQTYRAYLTVNSETKYLGAFPSGELAHAAYIDAKRKYHSGNTL